MNMEERLLTTTVDSWKTQQAIVFDWHDGPIQGVCALAMPDCEFAFDLIEERFNPDGLDDRLFRLREIPKGTIARILSLISTLGKPAHSVWIPVWSFADMRERASADAAIDELLNSSRHTNIVIRSDDMVTVRGCWEVISMPLEGKDWFSHLGID